MRRSGDCNDGNPTTFFGNIDTPDDFIDQDCDGTYDEGCDEEVVGADTAGCGCATGAEPAALALLAGLAAMFLSVRRRFVM